MKTNNLFDTLKQNAYPGRGIVLGTSADGASAVAAYFIMGRSENSRNRVFVTDGDGIRTQAFDPSKMVDPSLIIYAPVRVLGDTTIVTNGDQTDTVYDQMLAGKTFEESLRIREFEPDAPNYTPRISGIIERKDGYQYALSILKSADGNPDSCQRYTFTYSNPIAGVGHFIHTYQGDGNPLPSFEGEHLYQCRLGQPESGKQGFSVCTVHRPEDWQGRNTDCQQESINKREMQLWLQKCN